MSVNAKDVLVMVGLAATIVIGSMVNDWYNTHPCKRSHTEQQIVQPPAMIVGKTDYSGGVAVPMGNARIVTVEVCDER